MRAATEPTRTAVLPGPPVSARRAPGDGARVGSRAAERALFQRHRRRADAEARAVLIERFLPLARHLALRSAGSGESFEDVFQVACLALVKAVDRFDSDRGVAFSSYAAPTVLGEIKRHFRDTAWAVHVPRDLQEAGLRATRAASDLERRLGRRPTVREVAADLRWAEDDVVEALQATSAYRAASLEAHRRCDDEADVTLGETIGYDDERFNTVERRADLWALARHLSARERAALWLRFELGLTQPEIGRALGLSQVQVSRTLRRALARLQALDRDHDGAPAPPRS